MAHIILTGATGLAGSAILAHCLSSPAIARISILSRRPVKLAENQPKATVIIHEDFSSYPTDVLEQLRGAQGIVWAQGITSRGMTETEYSKITVDFPVAAAKALARVAEQPLKFVYMSGEGADLPPAKSMSMFGRVKGRAEKELLDLAEQDEYNKLRVYNIRPAVIDPEGNILAERSKNLQDRLTLTAAPIFRFLLPSFTIGTDRLAKVCVDLALGEGKPVPDGEGVEARGRLLRNTALRRLAAA